MTDATANPDLVKRRRLGQVFTPRVVADWMARWVCGHRPQRILDPAVGQGVFVDAIEAIRLPEPLSPSHESPSEELNAPAISRCPTSSGCHAGLGLGSKPQPQSKSGETLRGSRRFSRLPRRSSRRAGNPTLAAPGLRIEVCDIDADMLKRFAEAPRAVPVECRCVDFITARFRGHYGAIIANPPYIRHHHMDYSDDALRVFDRICRRRLSRMTNLYGLFLIKIWTLLDEHGRAAVITPAEWLNADFGVPIKAFLLAENAIDAIVHFDHASNVFEGALTTAAITLLRRDRRAGEAIRLLHVADVDELSAVRMEQDPVSSPRAVLDERNKSGGRCRRAPPALLRRQAAGGGAGATLRPGEIDPRSKWTPLFDGHGGWDQEAVLAPAISRCHTNLGRIAKSGINAEPTLGDIARCTRGIATGANDYFTLSESDRRRLGIDRCDLRVCITKAQDARGDRFTLADVQHLKDANRRIYLLHPRPRLAAAVERYLAEGRRRGVDHRYLPSHRPVWFLPEHREPAPILVSVFARGAFRFVLNEAEALNLTPYHAIYLRAPTRERIAALFDFLASPAAQSALASHRRIYGDGLLKVEPRDVEALPIPEELYSLCRLST